ncbi:uncharacterized protein LOC131941302 [Physella acuta]|uniref:uncharacterized protein LOC131941302 n=1 Tax=Physella acuta TaxID=109671 RepID=UPI0027DBA0A7|nr:uncharacterized protein LOC131941302 [Physella acuta]
MSVRRTRSGTPLGGSCESRRLRQTPSRKQHHSKPIEDAGADTNVEPSRGAVTRDRSSHHASAKKPPVAEPSAVVSPTPNVSLNIWERLEKEKQGFPTCVQEAGVEKSSKPERGSEQSDPELAKKGRKPELLLSLLEGEGHFQGDKAKHAVPVRTVSEKKCTGESEKAKASGSKTEVAENKKKGKEEQAPVHNSFSHSICIFPNCDHHSSEIANDFSHIPEVPGEPFFVSLSKDKNKELNMVKTSSGLVRVGCGLHKFLPSSAHSFHDSLKEKSTCSKNSHSTGESKTEDRNGNTLCPSEARVHVVRIDKDSKRMWSNGDVDSTKSTKADREDTATGSKFLNLADGECESFELGSMSDNPNLKNGISGKSSQFPLMEEILTEPNFAGFTGAISIREMAQIPKDDVNQQYKRAVSLLKASVVNTGVAAFKVEENSELDNKHVKRSERIRSKSGVNNLGIQQAVISTMKPTDNRPKVKSTLQRSKKKSKTFTAKEVQKKTKKVSVSKKVKSKGGSKNKSTMSREVMDAIIQSIEETISRAREDDDDDKLDSSGYHDNDGAANVPSQMMDPWPNDKDDSSSLSELSLTVPESPATFATEGKPKKDRKQPPNKRMSSQSKKVKKRSPSKSNTSRKKTKDPAPVCDSMEVSTTDPGTSDVTIPSAITVGDVGAVGGKRSRKRTRKAEEAMGDYDVFCDDDWPVKKSKRKRSSSSESASSSSQKRPRRSVPMGDLMTDPVLEEHAFILWASENRSQIEVQHPGSSTCEVDAMLSSRWCDVTDNVKARFFGRAREAFSDDDRHMIRSTAMAELELGALGDFFNDRDPVFIEFIRLPIDRQRELLRKWLKFFQKMLPKKEYIEFIVTFKRACARDGKTNGKPKRTRMRCLDPSHYKMLFDMIRLTKPRVLEVYKEKKIKEKKIVSDTYSLMLHKLVASETWPHVVIGCKSQLLTEILQDLEIPDCEVAGTEPSLVYNRSSNVTLVENDEAGVDDEVSAAFDPEAGHDARVSITVVNKTPQILEFKLDHGLMDVSLDEADYSVLNSDLALNLLSELTELKELPSLDQQMLDQVFLAPPRVSVTPTPTRRVVNLYGRRLESPTLSPSLPPVVGSPCPPRQSATSCVPYSKMNIHYPTNSSTSSSVILHHLPPTHTSNTLVPHKCLPRDVPHASPSRTVCCRKDSPMDMHSYSITMDSSSHGDQPLPKCIKVHPSTMPQQTKVNFQPFQLPVASRTHPQTKLHPRVVPVSCGFQPRFPGQNVIDKLGSHNVYHLGAQATPTTASRVYPPPLSLNAQSPLITSLSPLRGVKYNQGSKVYGQHCQMMPYRSRMQLATSTIGHCHRRSPHTVPVNTSLKPGAIRAQTNLHQIKVCLPTQSLKIPIAKLRGSRKTSYVKGKLKHMDLQPGAVEPYTSLPASGQTSPFNLRTGTPTSLLAKVLNLQVKNETQVTNKTPSEAAAPSTVLNTKSAASAFIGTMRPVGLPQNSSLVKPNTQVQLISVVSSSGHTYDIRSPMSTQTAVVVSPLTIHRSAGTSQSPIVFTSSNSAYTLATTPYSIASTTKYKTCSCVTTPTYAVSIASKTSSGIGNFTFPQNSVKTCRATAVKYPEGGLAQGDPPELVPGEGLVDEEGAAEDDEFVIVGTCTSESSGNCSDDVMVTGVTSLIQTRNSDVDGSNVDMCSGQGSPVEGVGSVVPRDGEVGCLVKKNDLPLRPEECAKTVKVGVTHAKDFSSFRDCFFVISSQVSGKTGNSEAVKSGQSQLLPGVSNMLRQDGGSGVSTCSVVRSEKSPDNLFLTYPKKLVEKVKDLSDAGDNQCIDLTSSRLDGRSEVDARPETPESMMCSSADPLRHHAPSDPDLVSLLDDGSSLWDRERKSAREGSGTVTPPVSSHMELDTVTPVRSLLAGRRPSDGKPESKLAAGPEVVKTKMTMCSVTVQPDTGCILVESLATRDKHKSLAESAPRGLYDSATPLHHTSGPRKRAHYIHEYLPT